ncbi:MAG TPA: flagellar motor switch protein FliN [Bryobacteraceae bacterium]|jgi:flagellar motor switch protein FliN/FliY|nr:flagellar motor switch protein FliN [Bryobacteraceae bacterium]
MKTSPARERLETHIESSAGTALSSLTGAEFTVTTRDAAADGVLEEPVIWQQAFSIVDGPSLWIAAGKDLWESMGRLTLESAGVDTVSEEDCRSTWLEILSQTIAGVAAGITVDVSREVTAAAGEELKGEPDAGLAWVEFAVTDSGGKVLAFRAAWSRALAGIYEPQQPESRNPAARDSAVSKTFDLLLEVALPVSVSFGRTSLQIREVLKLNTGSIVELDRFVNDPVEVIVNDCVIARGEVVVVDGNYGVRINELASREDRLKTGMTDSHRIGARP